MKIPKSHLTAEQPSVKKVWNLPKKIFYIQTQRNHYKMVGGAHLRYN